MTDIKASLGHLAVLAHGPILNWPHLADVATDAIDRIASLEAHVRFLERKAVDPVPNHKRSPMEHEHDTQN
jgi:hypothetical protein